MSNREAVVRSSAGLSDEQRQNIHGPFAASAYATQRKDRRSHRATLIAIGGIGTVVAVSTVCIFLVWVVVPLFLPATAGQAKSVSLPSAIADCVHFEVDEYRALGWCLSAAGKLRTFRLDDGSVIAERTLFAEGQPTAWSFGIGGREAICGFADGSVRTIRLGFITTFPTAADLPAELRDIPAGKFAAHQDGLLSRNKQGQLRLQTVRATVAEPIVPAGSGAITCVDASSRPTGRVCSLFDADGRLMLHAVHRRQALSREAVESRAIDVAMPYIAPADHATPRHVLVSGQTDNVYLIWDDGHLQRYDIRELEQPRLAEQLDLVPEPEQSVTALTFLPGKTTLVVGDSLGRVRTWFPTKPSEASTVDGTTLTMAHELAGPAAAVSSLTPSLRTRLVAAGYSDASLRVFHVTSDRCLIEIPNDGEQPVRLAAFTPKGDALVGFEGATARQWPLSLGFPEVSFAALFRAMWYEGYDAPRNVWQSSGGGDDFEPKLGMMPLVFGTLKATIYSLLFAVPLGPLVGDLQQRILAPA